MKSIALAICATAALTVAGLTGIHSATAASLGQSATAISTGSAVQTVQYLPRSGFPDPRMRGAVVDWCSTWSTDCGPGGANLFCQQHGFSRALSWDVIQVGHTYVIGSGRFCDADYCKGYSFIRCG